MVRGDWDRRVDGRREAGRAMCEVITVLRSVMQVHSRSVSFHAVKTRWSMKYLAKKDIGIGLALHPRHSFHASLLNSKSYNRRTYLD